MKNALEAQQSSREADPEPPVHKRPRAGLAEIPMDGTSKEGWLLVMEFVYPVVPAPDMTWQNLEVLIQLGHKYEIRSLLYRVDRFIQQNVAQLVHQPTSSPLHVWKWLTLADHAALVEACAACLTKLLDQSDTAALVCTPEELQGLSPKTLHMFLGKMSQKVAQIGPRKAYCETCREMRGMTTSTSVLDDNHDSYPYTRHITMYVKCTQCGATFM